VVLRPPPTYHGRNGDEWTLNGRSSVREQISYASIAGARGERVGGDTATLLSA